MHRAFQVGFVHRAVHVEFVNRTFQVGFVNRAFQLGLCICDKYQHIMCSCSINSHRGFPIYPSHPHLYFYHVVGVNVWLL